MKLLTLMYLVLYSMFSLSQQNIKGFIGVNQEINAIGFSYTETNLDFGITLPLNKGSISLFGTYGYGGNLKFDSISSYKLNYHLLGGGIKYRLFDKSKFYSPTLKITSLTEIASNYRGKKLGIDNYDGEGEFFFFPSNEIGKVFYDTKYSSVLEFYNAYDYISTPLNLSVFVGNELKIHNSLRINIGLGYLLSIVKVNYKQWIPNETEPQTKIEHPHRIKDNVSSHKIFLIHDFEISLGINYTFPFKKEKLQP